MASSRVPMTLRDFFFTDPFFKSSWDHFDKLREEMLKESNDFWKSVEEDMKRMDASMASMMSSSSSRMLEERSSSNQSMSKNTSTELANVSDDMFNPWFFPRRWMLPRMLSRDDGKLASLDLFQHKDDQVIRIKDDESKFEISLDTQGYKPDEIKVNVHGNVLTVEAKHEEKGANNFVARQFCRKYTLPEGCESVKVNSNLSSDGILMVTAPKKLAIKSAANMSIPVEIKH